MEPQSAFFWAKFDVNGTTVSFLLRSDAKGVTQFHYIFFIFVDDDFHVEN